VGQRKNKANRCGVCGLHDELCVCPSMPRFDLATKLLIVQHNRERHKPTNTARLGLAMFEGAQMIHYGARDKELDTAPLEQPDRDYVLLFPGDEARPLAEAPVPAPGRARTLVVLDGTWHQCSRMARRAPRIAEMPCYTLPEGPSSRWRIRTAPRPEALSTFEAICRATDVLSRGEAPSTRTSTAAPDADTDADANVEDAGASADSNADAGRGVDAALDRGGPSFDLEAAFAWFDVLVARMWQMRGCGPGGRSS